MGEYRGPEPAATGGGKYVAPEPGSSKALNEGFAGVQKRAQDARGQGMDFLNPPQEPKKGLLKKLLVFLNLICPLNANDVSG